MTRPRHTYALSSPSPQSGRHTPVLIGDTPYDVEGGLSCGVRVIGVATGRTGAEDLRAAGAAEVVEDLADTESMLKLLTK
ncbi:HAD family hydrolase [Streptomyces asiaticus]